MQTMFLLEPLDGDVRLSAVDNGIQLLVLDPDSGLLRRVIEIDGRDFVIARDEVVE